MVLKTKYRNIFKRPFCVALFISLSISGFAQSSTKAITEIQKEYKNGILSANEAYTQMKTEYDNGTIHKCTTPLHVFAHKHKAEISPSLLLPKEKAKSISSSNTYISPSGKFEFTYETTGSDAVPMADGNTNGIPDYVEWAAEAADSSYNHLILTLGYPDPIPADTTYDISFYDSNFYGETRTTGSVLGPATSIKVENDFVGFPENNDPDGDQRGALRVTIAHEFKHAIQYVQNEFKGDSDLWVEMDATLAEEVVYDDVNDYYNYLNSSDDTFINPEGALFEHNGCPASFSNPGGCYEDITWALFFHEKYGADFWPTVWSRIENSITDLVFLDAIKLELTSRGILYTEALRELYAWHFASGLYSSLFFGFDEASFYPTPNPQRTDTEITDQLSDSISVSKFSSYFLHVNPSETATGDVSILLQTSSSDISLAVVGIFKNGTVAFEYAEPEAGYMVVNEGWKWADIDRVGAIVLNTNGTSTRAFKIRVSDTFPTSIPKDETKPVITKLEQNYPNPFNPGTTIPVTISESQKVTIEVYDITGRLVQSVFNGNLSSGSYNFPINMMNAASGVYLYRLQTNERVQIKRMMLVK